MAEIFARRQVTRPHYLAKIMARANISRTKLCHDLQIDKGTVSRWLSDVKPATPSPHWARELGRYFASSPEPEDFVDIFVDPDVARFERMVRGRSLEDVDRMLATLEAAFSVKRSYK